MEKEEANWIYYEDAIYYCFECVEKRLSEINKNREFSDDIDYAEGEKCRHFQGTANEDREVECCVCEKPLFSNIDD